MAHECARRATSRVRLRPHAIRDADSGLVGQEWIGSPAVGGGAHGPGGSGLVILRNLAPALAGTAAGCDRPTAALHRDASLVRRTGRVPIDRHGLVPT